MTAYELGFKLATRDVSLNLAGSYYDYSDLQVSNCEGGQAHLNNANKARVLRFNADPRYRVSSSFEINAGLAVVDATYRDWPTAPDMINAAGLRMQFAPKSTGNVGARYTTSLAGGEVALSGNLACTSKMFFDSANQFSRRGFGNLELRAQWTDPSGQYTSAAFGENVTKDRHVTNITPQPLAVVAMWNSPSVYGVSLGLNF